MNIRTIVPAIVLAFAASGCATWEGMSARERSTAVGAGVGGVAGAVVTDGSPLGTIGGAAVGGVIGHEVGRRR